MASGYKSPEYRGVPLQAIHALAEDVHHGTFSACAAVAAGSKGPGGALLMSGQAIRRNVTGR